MILTNQPIQLKTVAFRCLPWLNTSKQNSTDRSEVHGNFSKQTTSSDCNDLETPVHVNDPNVLHFMSYSSAITDHELRQYLDNWVISQPAEADGDGSPSQPKPCQPAPGLPSASWPASPARSRA